MTATYAAGGRMAFDGELMRELWAPGDGSGDSDLDLIKASLNRAEGHPTWKLFCGELSDGPPPYVYLDDKMCYDVFNSGRFTGMSKGRYWPFDFGQHGGIRATRPNRGRAAYVEEGIGDQVVATCVKQGSKHLYYFWGEGGNPDGPSKRKRRAGFVELDETTEMLIQRRRTSPGPMDLVREDKRKMANAAARASNKLSSPERDGGQTQGHGDQGDVQPFEHGTANELASESIQEAAEISSLREQIFLLTTNFQRLNTQLSISRQSAKKHSSNSVVLVDIIKKNKAEIERLNNDSKEYVEKWHAAEADLSKLAQDLLVQRKMNEHLRVQNAELLAKVGVGRDNSSKAQTVAPGDPSDKGADAKKLQSQIKLLTELVKSFYFHFDQIKSSIKQTESTAAEQGEINSDLAKTVERTSGVCDHAMAEILDAKKYFEAEGFQTLWTSAMKIPDEKE